MKIAYIAMRVPERVEWYVGEEVRALRARGVEVVVCSVRRARMGELNEEEKEMAREVVGLCPWRWGAMVRAGWLCAARWHVVGEICGGVIGSKERWWRRMKALGHTWLGIYFAELLRGRGVEHIHAHHGYFASWAARVAARVMGITYSVTLHGSDVLVDGVMLGEKVREAAAVFTVSAYNKERLLERCPEVEAERVLVRRMGVRSEAGEREKVARGEELRMLAVGRLAAVKDFSFLVRAVAMLKARGVAVRCMIAGEGPERKNLERQIAELDVGGEVELVGSVERGELGGMYRAADVVVMTSRSEGMPLVLMEAMAQGAIVVAPRITGIPELVREGETGFLYRAGDLDDFLARVMGVRGRLGELEEVREGARRIVREEFDGERNVGAFCEELMGRVREGRRMEWERGGGERVVGMTMRG